LPYFTKGAATEGWSVDEPHPILRTCAQGGCARSFYVALGPHERVVVSSSARISPTVTAQSSALKAKETPLLWGVDAKGGGSATYVQPGYWSFAVITVALAGDVKSVPFTWHIESAPR
jgi:hypothetical protein